jgi:hypothetical protein
LAFRGWPRPDPASLVRRMHYAAASGRLIAPLAMGAVSASASGGHQGPGPAPLWQAIRPLPAPWSASDWRRHIGKVDQHDLPLTLHELSLCMCGG